MVIRKKTHIVIMNSILLIYLSLLDLFCFDVFCVMTRHKLAVTEEYADSQERFVKRLRKHGHQYRDNLLLKRIHKARKRNATCMDGSDARYYLSRRESNNWVIHLQSGGSCISKDECRDRANGPLGSSIPLDDKITGEWTLSDDPNINPTFHKWNKVLIPYCSGDVFVGRQSRNNHPYRLPMLGHYILVAVIEELISKHKINMKKKKILFGGTSAGGVGVLANIDHVQKIAFPAEGFLPFRNTEVAKKPLLYFEKVKGYVDSGWFTLYPNYGENKGFVESGLPKFFNTLTELFEDHWDGFADESCRKEMPKAAACLYGQLVIPYIKTPVFVLSSFWDSYQITQMISVDFPLVNIPPKKKDELEYFALFANNTRRSLLRVIASNGNGVFAPSCYSHTFFTSCIDGILCGYPNDRMYYIKGQTAYGALTEWYKSNGRKGSYLDDVTKDPSCNPSCCTVNCYKCRAFNHHKNISNSINQYNTNNQNGNNYNSRPIVYYSTSTINKPKIMTSLTFICIVIRLLDFLR